MTKVFSFPFCWMLIIINIVIPSFSSRHGTGKVPHRLRSICQCCCCVSALPYLCHTNHYGHVLYTECSLVLKTIDYILSPTLVASLVFKRLTRMSILSSIYINEYVQRMVNVFIQKFGVVWFVSFSLLLFFLVVSFSLHSFPLVADEDLLSSNGRQLVLHTQALTHTEALRNQITDGTHSKFIRLLFLQIHARTQHTKHRRWPIFIYFAFVWRTLLWPTHTHTLSFSFFLYLFDCYYHCAFGSSRQRRRNEQMNGRKKTILWLVIIMIIIVDRTSKSWMSWKTWCVGA